MMNTIIVNNDKMIGNSFVLLDIKPWKDFNNNDNILGCKIVVGIPNKFEKINVKINKIYQMKDEYLNQNIDFVNLIGTVYFMNNRNNISWKADDIKIRKNS